MILSSDYRIWEAAATTNERPVLQEVLIERTEEFVSLGVKYNGLAIAANGFMLGVVPVQLDEQDVPGLVKASVLENAAKQAPKKNRDIEIALLETEVRFDTKIGPVSAARSNGGQFPEWRKILPDKHGEVPDLPFGINPRSYLQLCNAVGLSWPKMTRTAPQNEHQELGPVIVEPFSNNGDWKAPYGLLMPVGRDHR